MNRRKPSSPRAFTLLEILLAIAVSGLLLAASSYFMVSLATIWSLRTDEDSFEEHADGVAAFLQRALNEASSRHQPKWKDQDGTSSSTSTKITSSTSTTTGTTGKTSNTDATGTTAKDGTDTKSTTGTTSDTSDSNTTTGTTATTSAGQWMNAGITMTRTQADEDTEPPLLHFFFFQFPPALGATTPATTLGVEAWLKFDEKAGLAIVWKDIWSIQDTIVSNDKDLLRTTVISPFVTKINYIYYDSDAKRWNEYEAPYENNGTYAVPTFIRLVFTQNGHETTRTIRIQATARKMPLF